MLRFLFIFILGLSLSIPASAEEFIGDSGSVEKKEEPKLLSKTELTCSALFSKWTTQIQDHIRFVSEDSTVDRTSLPQMVATWYQHQSVAFRNMPEQPLEAIFSPQTSLFRDTVNRQDQYGLPEFMTTKYFSVTSDDEFLMRHKNKLSGFVAHAHQMSAVVSIFDPAQMPNSTKNLSIYKIIDFGKPHSEIQKFGQESVLSKTLQKLSLKNKSQTEVDSPSRDYLVVTKVLEDAETKQIRVFAISRNGSFYISDFDSGQILKTYTVPDLKVTGAVGFANHEKWIVTADQHILEFDLKSFTVTKVEYPPKPYFFPALVRNENKDMILAQMGFLNFVLLDPENLKVVARFVMDHLPTPFELKASIDVSEKKVFEHRISEFAPVHIGSFSPSLRQMYSNADDLKKFPLDAAMLLERLTHGDSSIAFTPTLLQSFIQALDSVLDLQNNRKIEWDNDGDTLSILTGLISNPLHTDSSKTRIFEMLQEPGNFELKNHAIFTSEQYRSVVVWRTWQILLLRNGLADNRIFILPDGKRVRILDSKSSVLAYYRTKNPAVRRVLSEVQNDPEEIKLVLTLIEEMIPGLVHMTDGLRTEIVSHRHRMRLKETEAWNAFLYPNYKMPPKPDPFLKILNKVFSFGNYYQNELQKSISKTFQEVENKTGRPAPILNLPSLPPKPLAMPAVMENNILPLSADDELLLNNLNLSAKYSVVRNSLSDISEDTKKVLNTLITNSQKSGPKLNPVDFQKLINGLLMRKREISALITQINEIQKEGTIYEANLRSIETAPDVQSYRVALSVIRQGADADSDFLNAQLKLIDATLRYLPAVVIQVGPTREKAVIEVIKNLKDSLNQKLF